jgi:glycosyltransferase involved in cell wall biosynthesis
MSFIDPASRFPYESHIAPTYQRSVPGLHQDVEVSIVMPCLNEASGIEFCIAEARAALDKLGVQGEVIVVDNGSTDDSVAIARAAGARVVHEPERGYGNACRRGFAEARGRYLVMGDSDGTYDFSAVPELIGLLEANADVALGNRLTGAMEAGSMPWTHRRLGTPFLTGVVNLLFGAEIGDVNCGLRGITRAAYQRLDPQANGMEFASEFLVKAIQHDLDIAQVPVPYRRRRGGEVKLRTISDGLRHLRLVLSIWLNQGRRASAPVPMVALAGTSDVTVDLREADEIHADRLRL